MALWLAVDEFIVLITKGKRSSGFNRNLLALSNLADAFRKIKEKRKRKRKADPLAYLFLTTGSLSIF
jgi:hypothetical protein